MHRLSAQQGADRMRSFALRMTVAVALPLLLAGPALAGSDLRRGTDGAHELQIPVGARGSALGGTVIGDVSGVEAIYWNPAGLAATDHNAVLFSHTNYLADMKLNYVALVTRPGGNLGVLGFNAKVLSVGDVIVTTEDAPDGTGEILSPTFAVLGATWAKQFTDRVLFGGTVNYVSERIANVGATGLAFDFGVQYLTEWKGLRFGMAMKNVGPSMEFSGAGLESSIQPPGSDPSATNRVYRATTASFQMPSSFSLAGSMTAHRDSRNLLTVLAAFQNNNFTGDVVRGGAEWMYRDVFALRGAWFGTYNSSVDATTGEEVTKLQGGEQSYSGYSLGAGATMRTGETGHVGVDFAWRPVRAYFDDTLEMSLTFKF
jgi:hypothetical protein